MKEAKENVYLRALGQHDLDRVLNWHNNPELYSTLGGHFRYVNQETETDWLRHRLEARGEINLAICLFEPHEHIGNIYLRNIEWIDRNAELHTFIAQPEYRGKGYGSEAIRQLTRHAFNDLGLARIYLYVLAKNSTAIATYEKCGFAIEGRLRRHIMKAGSFEDVIVMGLCRQ